VVLLAAAHRRLKVDDGVVVSRMARRLAAARWAALDDGASLVVKPEGWQAAPGARRLTAEGAVRPLEAA